MWPLTLAAAALASPCQDTLDLLERGVSAAAVSEVAGTLVWTVDDLTCLADGAAPRRVVSRAARSADLPVPPDPRPRPWELALGPVGFVDGGLHTPGGVDAHLAWRPAPPVAIDLGATLGIQPDEGYRASVDQVPPPASELALGLGALSRAAVQLAPISGELRAGRSALALRGYGLVGFGVVQTVDDPEDALQRRPQERWELTRSQLHPTLHWGGGVGFEGAGALGFRLQVEQARWVEVYDGLTLDGRQLVAASVALTLRP